MPSMVHVVTPWGMMFVLGIIHAQIIATRPSHRLQRNTQAKARRYVTFTQHSGIGVKVLNTQAKA